jgi:hypothetical protein
MKRLLILAALTLGAGGLITTAASSRPVYPVNVTACSPAANVSTLGGGGWVPVRGGYYYPTVYGYRYYQPPVRTASPSLGITYTNASDKAMRQIEFGLVANGNLVAEVKDVGTFSPGVQIKHEFGLNPNVFPLQTALARCVPLKVTFDDGTKWRNPHLPALRHKLGM